MTTPSAALDANVIVGLAKGSVFDYLADLYEPLYITAGIRQEVVDRGVGRAGAAELQWALGNWITEIAPSPTLVAGFRPGISLPDRQILAVAVEKSVDVILTGDRKLRLEAVALGFRCLAPSEVIVVMKRRGLIPRVRAVLDEMRLRGLGISDEDYDHALKTAGE